MAESIIEIQNLTKDYGNGKGTFDINISVSKGEVFGFLGPNGAGKTTTIRQLMGFLNPDKGQCKIGGLNCFNEREKIQENLGYLAGEIAFLEDLTGKQMLDFIAEMKGIKDKSRIEELMTRFELDPKGKVKKMSKGMKQKVGIICAFMHNPEVVILDEPTSGLDPLMQNRFVELIIEEKEKGTTIFMSSHIFEEIERTCDRAAIIKDGKIIAIEEMATLKSHKQKQYVITFADKEEAERFVVEERELVRIKEVEGQKVVASIEKELKAFLNGLSKYDVQELDVKVQTLEELFLHFYGGEK